MKLTSEILKNAKTASLNAALSLAERNKGLDFMAESLLEHTTEILAANSKDVENAKGKISDVMIDRLRLDKSRISAMADGIRSLIDLSDPLGRELTHTVRDGGLDIKKISVPIGVIAIIYESRPNVTSDAAALCFKSGNVCVLRSGKEAFSSAYEIVSALKCGLTKAGINADYINLVEDTTRQSANDLMTAVGYVDLLIPRGGKGLIKACVDNAKVPCVETGTGICHIYVDSAADIDMALDVVVNAKTSRPSVCNAAEVCLVNRKIASEFLPALKNRFDEIGGVEIRGDSEVCSIINAVPANENDFDTEFLDYIMAVKIVDNADEAVKHIGAHSTHHSDAIITEDKKTADYFVSSVDSAAVYVNASTRFTDGGEFGLGCEMGISTQKLHARGPMGLQELTTYKYVIHGNGNIR